MMEGGWERTVYIISLRTLLTALFVFCQTATKTVTTDLFTCAWVLSGCRFIPVLVQVHFCSPRSSAQAHACVYGVCSGWASALAPFISYMETHQDRRRASYRQALVDVTQRLQRYLVSAWVNARAPGRHGQLPSFKGKATMVCVKGTLVLIVKTSVSSNIIRILYRLCTSVFQLLSQISWIRITFICQLCAQLSPLTPF